MTQATLPASLADLQAAYLAAQPGAAPAAAPPPPAQSFAPPPQAPPGYYIASDGNTYPLQPQAFVAAPAPAPAPAQPSGFSIPPQQAAALATQHAQAPLPINPPEAQQALLPGVQAVMPEPKKRGRGKAKAAVAGAPAAEGGEEDLASAILAVAALLPKGSSLTIAGEG